ncbi:MAG TPA: lecithin retinol acyltransferase family protein [Candidatus Hydrogenedentes bacterium]|nr:lecithin retinol acyltransferase family protein [Candidatus Hydrogenedentota bacterium]HOK89188.1 lecithin retinol acyltransferase family protein [Candidatus Hydrogenedentota bacterium]HOV59597.1 lecithin retinol acyltransferase family protein [Candidatus Hydrogenedentota bacterium]
MATGDHIRVPRLGGLYYHHGIDVGNGRVIHFSGEPLHPGNAMVREVSLEDFLEGAQAEVVDHENALPPDETVRLARSRIGETGYNLLFNNCEHFATWCKTGKPQSRQVYKAAKTVLQVAAATAVVLLLGRVLFPPGPMKKA